MSKRNYPENFGYVEFERDSSEMAGLRQDLSAEYIRLGPSVVSQK